MKLVYDCSSYLSFDELLIKVKSVSIYQRNLQLFATDFMVTGKELVIYTVQTLHC